MNIVEFPYGSVYFTASLLLGMSL